MLSPAISSCSSPATAACASLLSRPLLPTPASSSSFRALPRSLFPPSRVSLLPGAAAPSLSPLLSRGRRTPSPRAAYASPMTPSVTSDAIRKGNQRLLVFPTEEELAVSLAKYTAELSEKFVAERGAFTVVLSGGSLIDSIRKLAEVPYLESVDWSKWHIFWVDERVVPKDHDDSNYKLALDGFLSKVPIPPSQVYAINDTLSAEGAAEDYETCLKQLVKTGVVAVSTETGFPKFDLMLLGMGPDGHIASLFPGHPLLKEKERWVTFIKDSPKPPPERITFTFPVINSSSDIAMVVNGAGKAGAVAKALGSEKNSSDLLPVEMVSIDDGKFAWFTDKAAVSMLEDKENL